MDDGARTRRPILKYDGCGIGAPPFSQAKARVERSTEPLRIARDLFAGLEHAAFAGCLLPPGVAVGGLTVGQPVFPGYRAAGVGETESQLGCPPQGGQMPESDPIRVFAEHGKWLIDYGSYVHGSYATRAEAIETAKVAAQAERRELVIEANA